MFKNQVDNVYDKQPHLDKLVPKYDVVGGIPCPEPPWYPVVAMEEEYKKACQGYYWYDINEHIPTLRRKSQGKETVVEFGLAVGCSARGLLSGRPKHFISVDVKKAEETGAKPLMELTKNSGIKMDYICGSDLDVELPEVDVLHIDSLHTEEHLSRQLYKHHKKIKSTILIHDTNLDYLKSAIDYFISSYPLFWRISEHHTYNNGMTILERIKKEKNS